MVQDSIRIRLNEISLADFLYMLHVFVRFRTAFVAPSSRVFGRGELVLDRKEIARRYIRSGFFIDLIAALPLPQIVIWFIIPAIKLSKSRIEAPIMHSN
ncbi:hypothetical protein SOVF_090730 [Spinacia oleracea]|nr:hypothetical protein SOVF_090730 [Spinacia oleracea]